MKPVILFRRGIDGEHEEECRVARQFFDVYETRAYCPANSLVVGRFSTLPYYRELQEDLEHGGSTLINAPWQHDWIAGFGWYADLREFTFETWTDADFHRAPEGAYVIKGRTNSRKSHWNTHMFAATKREAIEVAGRLTADQMIMQQGLVYRKYEPLVTYEIGIHGQRFTNEWRFFFLGNERIEYGRYWTIAEHPEKAEMNDAGLRFADRVADVVHRHARARFYVLDIAQKEDGNWVLVEVNEGQQAGLSAIDPTLFYSSLLELLK